MNKLIRPTYRPDIDGLRAVAVLLVIAFHAFPTLVPGGFIGVDMFFVISGFLISTIIFSNVKRGTFSFLEFYQRRVRRIFPALILVLLACSGFGWFALYEDEYAQLGKHLMGGAGFVDNLLLWSESGYFDNSAETKPLLHLWSLGIEEQFYLIWPLLLAFTWKKIRPLTVVLGVCIASFAYNVLTVELDSMGAYYSPMARFWELAEGAALAYAMLYRWKVAGPLRTVRSVLGMALIGVGAIYINPQTYYPGWWAILPVAGTALLIGTGPDTVLNGALGHPALRYVGKISYPLYLWHWPLLSFAHIVMGRDLPVSVTLTLLAATFVLAAATYHLLERPIQIRARRGAVLATWMFVLGAAGFAIYSSDGVGSRAIALAHQDLERQFSDNPFHKVWPYMQNEICQNKYPLEESRKYAWWFCMANKEQDPTLIILGNSFANHLYPGIALNPELQGQSVLSIGTCGVIGDGWHPSEVQSPCYGDRPLHQKALIDRIISKGTVKFAIIDGLGFTITKNGLAELKTRIAFLEKNGIKIIVFVPHIHPDYSVKTCFGRLGFAGNSCKVGLDEYRTKVAQFEPVVDAIHKSRPGVLFFDQNALYCGPQDCSFVKEGLPLFRDGDNHLSVYGSLELGKLFAQWAETNLPELVKPGKAHTVTARRGSPQPKNI